MRDPGAEPPVRWWWVLALYTPVLAFYGAHYAAGLIHPGISATGFVHYDVPYTMACAREFVDNGLHGLLFTLPSGVEADGGPVLLQLHMWMLGQVWRWFPMDPGLLYFAFGTVCGLLAVRSFVRLFDAVVPVEGARRRIGHVLFLWGGGLLAVSGELLNLLHGRPIDRTWTHLLDLDPAYGWWMMNLGRCLILPNEAYYHLLFFSAALAFVRARHRTALICLLLLAASHPFAGVGGLVVFFTWSVVERVIVRDPDATISVPIVLATAFALCCWYYFAWLPGRLDPALAQALPSRYIVEARSILPAYLLVLLPAMARLRTRGRLRAFLSQRSSRMLLTMAVVQFVLENHEVFTRPYQPAHFTRGYTWAALFLIGAPWLLNEALPWIGRHRPRARTTMVMGGLMLLLSDNLAFFALNIKRELRASPPGFWLTVDQRGVLDFLGTLPRDSPLVITQEEDLGYMVIVYTPLRAYRSHFFDDVDAWSRVGHQADYFAGRITDPLLAGPLIVVAVQDSATFVPPGNARSLYTNAGYSVFRTE